MITAIPTMYNGVQFRSRLEARWASFFDLVKWRWEYEPMDLDGWIPDFALKGTHQTVLIEIKPSLIFSKELHVKLNNAVRGTEFNGSNVAFFGNCPAESFSGYGSDEDGHDKAIQMAQKYLSPPLDEDFRGHYDIRKPQIVLGQWLDGDSVVFCKEQDEQKQRELRDSPFDFASEHMSWDGALFHRCRIVKGIGCEAKLVSRMEAKSLWDFAGNIVQWNAPKWDLKSRGSNALLRP